uniref:CASP-like protein n=1 Tax=Panagrellus redivivus TaxID=6233 RepID=A0A7E4ZZP8_PANRE
MPKTMYDFRPCLCVLCVLDGLFAFFLGVVIDVTFQFPALAGVIKSPIIMFLYRYVGYDGCKVIVCSTFTFMAGIVYFQNYGINFRFVTIHPNKKLYDMYNSKKALFAIYVGGFCTVSTIGIAIYILMYPERNRWSGCKLSEFN